MLCFRGADAILLLWPPRGAVGLLHRTENRRIVRAQDSLVNTIPSEKHIHSVYPPNQAPARAAQTLTTGDMAAIGKRIPGFEHVLEICSGSVSQSVTVPLGFFVFVPLTH